VLLFDPCHPALLAQLIEVIHPWHLVPPILVKTLALGSDSLESSAYCWIALSLQGLGPTWRANVQYSSNFTGSVRLPSITWLLVSSTE